jgi:HK97 family phage major capsid protein
MTMTVTNQSYSLEEVRNELHGKRDELFRIQQEAGPELDMSKIRSLPGDSQAKVDEIQRRKRELDDLGAKFDRLALVDEQLRTNERERERMNLPVGRPAVPGGSSYQEERPLDSKRLRQMLVDHKGYGQFRGGSLRSVTIDLPGIDAKTLITLTTVNAQADRRAGVNMALEERTVADLMLQGQTDNNTVEYYEETTVTNAATTVAEGGTKPESALAWTLRTESVRKIATWIPATKESLDDVSWLESQIRGRLAFMVTRVEESQILTGDGTAPNLRGILNRSGIQTQAKGADPTPDAIYRAMQKIRGAGGSGFAEPTAVVLHPNDWTDIKLLRTTDGIYIWGNPSDEGPDRIWGLPVRQTTAMTENTGLVGAFRPYAEVLRREGIQITLSTEHSTYFIENKVAILAESRLALAVYRPSAFATVTGI